MRPLVERYLPRLPAHPDRPPRIVLVPMGDLARVPWQAARRPDGRYAIELIAVSQAASARMLVRSATLPAVPLGPAGLVVGDPDTREAAGALPAARLEAYAIRQTFYRGARYLGRRPDGSPSRSGPGTAAEVRAWLTNPGPAAGGLLHLACHGFVQEGGARATAYLLLAGGDRLTAEELVALLARTPERAVGLVVLAACRTGLSLNGYDEAYSLGTAFLAGGVRTVLSSQWSVPDSATSVLMFMVHRRLRAGGRAPWAALRDAQLWMLDPAREVPADMPGPLRRQLAGVELGAVQAWAAFLHWGQ
jgi:CHAT domain-containing protein